MDLILLSDLTFGNTRFWAYFLSTSYPCGLLERTDETMYDLVQQVLPVDTQWSDTFTKSYDGVFEDSDGYLNDPTTLVASLEGDDVLEIEFHPGDTIFYINGEEIGCTGPHWKLWVLSCERIRRLLALPDGPVLFQLLLPMAVLTPEEAAEIRPLLLQHLSALGVTPPVLPEMADCLLSGLVRQIG